MKKRETLILAGLAGAMLGLMLLVLYATGPRSQPSKWINEGLEQHIEPGVGGVSWGKQRWAAIGIFLLGSGVVAFAGGLMAPRED